MCSFLCEYGFHFSEIYFPRGQLPSHLVILHLIVLETISLPCRVAGPSYILTSNAYVVHFLISIWPCYLFKHSVTCALTSHCGFNLHLLVSYDSEHLLMSLFVICISSPGKHVGVSSPFCNWITACDDFCQFAINFEGIFIYTRNQQDMVIQDSVHKYFLPLCDLSSPHLMWSFPECKCFILMLSFLIFF